jgi:zinc transport system substrate-binding protein
MINFCLTQRGSDSNPEVSMTTFKSMIARGLLAWCVTGVGLSSVSPGALAQLNVVASSKAAHALVATVMGDVATPRVLISGQASPHNYALKPSDAMAANGARVFFRLSEQLEPFTAKLAKALPASVRLVSLQNAPGVVVLDRRDGGSFEGHGGSEHKGHDHNHASVKKTADKAAPNGDAHSWLDPRNASAMLDHIANVLAEVEPDKASIFKANAQAGKLRLVNLEAELSAELKDVAGKPFVVLHDAYQYFEARFGLTAIGSITVNPETAPSGKRLSAVRSKMKQSGAACLIGEPGMQPKVIAAVIEGTKARSVQLDPEATQLVASAALYEASLRDLAKGFIQCLTPAL